MADLVGDTHALVWYLADHPRLSATARARMDAAVEGGGSLFVPSVCLVELIYLVERGRLPEAALAALFDDLTEPGARLLLAPLDEDVARAVRRIPRDAVPDMPDRIIAATALALGVPLVTRDRKIRSADLETIW